MNRSEYMKRLEAALSDIALSERDAALQYYNDYFDDAGVENEAEVMKSLGEPETLAQAIKKDQVDMQDTYLKTETDTYDYTETQKEDEKKSKLSGGTIALIVILGILASPLIIALLGAALGAIVGILAGIFSAILALISIFISFIVVVFACILSAIAVGAISPFGALVFAGAGIMMIGISIFLLMAIVWLFGCAVPWIVKQIIKLCKKIFGKKGGNQ